MTKTLAKHGNSFAIVIDRPVMDLLDFDPEKPVEVTTDGKSLIVTPVKTGKPRPARLSDAIERANRKFGKAFKNLAK